MKLTAIWGWGMKLTRLYKGGGHETHCYIRGGDMKLTAI